MQIGMGSDVATFKKGPKPPINFKQGLRDPTLISLILSNLLTIALAVIYNFNIMAILWVYWSQSVIIGLFNVFRILSLKNFSTKGFRINQKPVEANRAALVLVAFFFAIHYGMFHFVYAFFLGIFTVMGQTGTGALSLSDFGYIGFMAIVFFANHLFSFLHNRKQDVGKQNIGRVMMYPYARIIPMHLTIILGGIFLTTGATGAGLLIFFLGLKTLADVAMHFLEHSK
ncbi:MAG: DUF6498-containing protein [archaeon]|jgi:hypothetical protein|nr:DUF6498-containing protein [archaeon]